MQPAIEWSEAAVRLGAAVVAGGLVGYNREEHGRAAGLCTMILVSVAAAVSMIQVNFLLPTGGRQSDSFIMMDLMRLPLGILSGMGFIGAGAILRRGDAVVGVTTAATLWFVTVMGLCFGGGQLVLGAGMLGIALVVLWLLKWIERRIIEERTATLRLRTTADGPSETAIRDMLHAAGFHIASCQIGYAERAKVRQISYELRWRGTRCETRVPGAFDKLAQTPGVRRLEWKP
ncbi:MAG TPA: MgtC/SapB family protein [Pirellulales bacterium]|nr:MgtC/SapB family protein [Pirellulales bacterium]